MLTSDPVLHLVCGKPAAGKSTLTAKLAEAPSTVLISEDYWLARLYRDELITVQDYVRYSQRLRAVVGPHIENLLRIGVSVVLDFPANTVSYRAWMRGLFEHVGARHRLHFLDVPDDVCKARLRVRNAKGEHDFAPTDSDFALITSYFVPPGEEEGFEIVRYRHEELPKR